ncbi:SDR family NAD(P)-dependent oxidoreductase [[Eubacterium] cellulosolvens]
MIDNIFRKDLLKGEVAIITGAGRGIGRGIALGLSRLGANIVLVDVNKLEKPHHQYRSLWSGGFDEALKAVKEIRNNKSIAVECDITKDDQVSSMVKKTIDTFGRIDILVNNAGIVKASDLTDIKEEEWDYGIEVNTKGAFLCCRKVVPYMKKKESGRIINISSVAGFRPYAGMSNYCSSKFAIIGFTQSLALELAPFNITANVICPGIVNTQMWTLLKAEFKKPDEKPEEFFKRYVHSFIPLGRAQTPEDIAATVVFLASMSNITGAIIPVSGGAELTSARV